MTKKIEAATAPPKNTRGGARAGSGRKQMYGEPMQHAFTARVNEAQGAALGAWCRKKRIAPATFLREVGLLRAGAQRLGLGLDVLRGSVTAESVMLSGAAIFPVKVTDRQAAAINNFCARKKIAPGTWLREAGLEHIGREDLGLRGQAAQLGRSL